MAVACLTCLTLSCGASKRSPGHRASATDSPLSRCHYRVTVSPPAGLAVRVTCDAPIQNFVASEAVMAGDVRMRTAAGAAVAQDASRFVLPRGVRAISYRIDLAKVARDHGNIDVAYEATGPAGTAWMAAVSTWILRPHPLSAQTRASIEITMPESMRFATSMPRMGNHYEILAHEIRNATYGVFGAFTAETIRLPGPFALETPGSGKTAHIELVTLPGALSSSSKTRLEWVRETADATAEFWRGFPVERAMVVLVPTQGHASIAHGKVVAAGGAAVAIHVGSRARRADLYGDWILVHELFHLGFPSFAGEGKWLDEGLATYFEPIIRARAGWLSPQEVWGEYARGMDQGLSAVEVTGVEKSDGFAGIYWGGAILALLADTETRHRTHNELGLEDGLRAVLGQGGNASKLWKLDRAIGVVDERLGAPTLRTLADAHSFSGRPVDLPRLWHELGVRRVGDETTLDDGAAQSALRRAILTMP